MYRNDYVEGLLATDLTHIQYSKNKFRTAVFHFKKLLILQQKRWAYFKDRLRVYRAESKLNCMCSSSKSAKKIYSLKMQSNFICLVII